ncbi:MAG: carbohydrate ABC transporter permease, partial [Spirochaetota bacterium]
MKYSRHIMIYLGAALVVFLCLFPFIVQLSVSLKPVNEWQEPNIIPREFTFAAYAELLGLTQHVENLPPSVQKVLGSPKLSEEAREQILKKYVDTSDIFPFLKYMKNSLLFAGLSSLFSIVLAIMGAYSVSRLHFPGRKLIQRSIL